MLLIVGLLQPSMAYQVALTKLEYTGSSYTVDPKGIAVLPLLWTMDAHHPNISPTGTSVLPFTP